MVRRLLVVSALLCSAGTAWSQGNPLGPEFRVNTSTFNIQSYPNVARSSDSFVVVWGSGPIQGSTDVLGQRYADSGLPLGTEFPLNTTPGQISARPAVALQASGNFVVVWEGVTADGYRDVFGRRYAASGEPFGPEFVVNSYTTGDQGMAVVASGPLDAFVVAWTGLDQDGSYNVFAQRYAPSGAPVGPEFRVNDYTTSTQRAPSIGSDAAGNFVICWESWDQEGYLSLDGIFGRRFSQSGAPLGPEFQVNTFTTGRQQDPSVASDASGNTVVVWRGSEQAVGISHIYAQRFASTGTPLGAEFLVSTSTANDQVAPAVASDASGNLVVVWRGLGDGGYQGVFGQRYLATGDPSGGAFRVNTNTSGFPDRPAVGASPAGDFVVVWNSPVPGPPDLDIFGQRYGQIVPVDLTRFTVD